MTWAKVGWICLDVGIFLAFITVVVLALTYLERKVMGRIQQRIGPMRTGPLGLLQPIADAIKLMVKEDYTPGMTDKVIFWAAPLVVFVPAFVMWVSIPFTRDLVIRNMDLGLFFILAVSVVSIVGLIMAGWSSFNKYAYLGAARAAAQMISYELPLIIGVLGIVMISQSTDMQVIVAAQNPVWFIAVQPVAFVLFLMASLAEVGRSPFDIPYAESEVVGGPMIEYSGIHWAMFFLAEYANTFAIAVLTTLLFLGGWNGPALPSNSTFAVGVSQAFWFLLKTSIVIMLIFWIRATLPRFRIDQLMSLAWKVLVPLAFLNLVLTAVYLFFGWPKWSMFLMSVAVIIATYYILRVRGRARMPVTRTVKITPTGVADDRTV